MGIHVLLVAVQNHKSPVQPHGKLGAVMSMVPEGAAGVRLDSAKGFSNYKQFSCGALQKDIESTALL